MKGVSPYVSIIIPTYNRAKLLALTIETFLSQDYPRDRYEIIVSDNNSIDSTKEVVSACQRKSQVPVRYLFEGRQGVHYARNSAAKKAKGELLYFTDDDMIADKELLKNLVKVFQLDRNVASATGKVLPKWEAEPPKWIRKYCLNSWLSLQMRDETLLIAPYDVGIYSCHQAILKEVFFKSGGFNPENTAGEWIGDGETGLNMKIRELGYQFAFVGDSIIYHMIPLSRMTQAYINKRMANQGNCDSYTDFRMYRSTDRVLLAHICRHALHMCSFIIGFALSISLCRDSWRMYLARTCYCWSRIRYDLRLVYDAKWRELVLKYDWLEE